MSTQTEELLKILEPLPLPPEIAGLKNDIFWCRKPSKKAFHFAIKNTPCFLFETCEDGVARTVETGQRTTPALHSLFFLTTASCYRLPIAEWLSDALQAQYKLSPSLTMHIHIALHEAISNAVIHGNLGIAGNFKNRKEFTSYYYNIEEKLHDRSYRFKRITIGMHRSEDGFIFGVADEGNGYDSTLTYEGKGLGLIRDYSTAMQVQHGGSLIEMHFAT